MNAKLSVPKILAKRKKKKSKTKHKINKLFDKLRDSQSENSFTCSSFIPLETIMLPAGSPPGIIDETNNSTTDDENCIVINDDDVIVNNNISTPKRSANKFASIKCSTPISNHQSLDRMILNNNLSILRKSQEEVNLTKEINRDSYLTIDLTADSESDRTFRTNNTVVNLTNTSEATDCTIISVNDSCTSINYDSDVTVVSGSNNVDAKMDRFARGISKLNASEKGKLLQIIAQNVFNGCNLSKNIRSLTDIRVRVRFLTFLMLSFIVVKHTTWCPQISLLWKDYVWKISSQ